MPRKSRLSIDIVIPVFNEAGVVEQTYANLCAVIDSLPYTFTIYYVNDGSTDATSESLAALAKKDKRVQVIELSRNFGHQAALTAGIDTSRGDLVITMDCDGQHPPELIPEMVNLFKQGYDVIQGQRSDAVAMGTFKKWTSGGFYKILNLDQRNACSPWGGGFSSVVASGSRGAQGHAGISSLPARHDRLDGISKRDPALSRTGAHRGKVEIFLGKNDSACVGCDLFLFVDAALYRIERWIYIHYSGACPNDLCSGLVADASDESHCARLEFVDGGLVDCQRHHHDFAWLHRRLCGIYISGSETKADLSDTPPEAGGMNVARRISFPLWTIPAALLVVVCAAYGLFAAQGGIHWDDWAIDVDPRLSGKRRAY